MIENERQYKVALAKVSGFESEMPKVRKASEKYSGRLGKALRDSTESQIADLKKEIKEYEDLCQQKTRRIRMSSIVELGECLIKGRLFRGYTQAQLADRLNLHAQQIQRYEASRYESARLTRIVDVMEALELVLDGVIELQKGQEHGLPEAERTSHVEKPVRSQFSTGEWRSGMSRSEGTKLAQSMILDRGLWGCVPSGRR